MKKLDPVIKDLLAEPIGESLLKALKLQYMGGITSFKADTTLRIIEKIYKQPVRISVVRSRLRRLADGGFLKESKGGRFELLQLFLSKGAPFYQRRSPTFARHIDEMIWISLEAEDTASVIEMASAAMERGDTQEARNLLEKLTESGERISRGEAYHKLALLEEDGGDFDKAAFCFREAMKQGVRDEFLYADYARFKMEKGEGAGAIAILKDGLLVHKNSAAIHDLLAQIHSEADDQWRAEYHRFRTIVGESDLIPVKAGIADQMATEGRFEGALTLYREASRSARRNCYPLYRMAYIHANKLGDTAAASELFGRILKVQPDDKTARNNIRLLKSGKLPLPEQVNCHIKNKRLTWRPERPGTVEIVSLNNS